MMLRFPPFFGNDEAWENFQKDLLEYEKDWNSKWTKATREDNDTSELEKEEPFAPLMKKYADDIEEARLYMKRYGSDWKGAEAALAAVKGNKTGD